MIHAFKISNPDVSTRTGKSNLVFLPGVNLLIGPNGSGKSTLLLALHQQVAGQRQHGTLTQDRSMPVMYHSSEYVQPPESDSDSSTLGQNYMSFGQRMRHLLGQIEHIHSPHTFLLDEPETALDFQALYDFCAMVATNTAGHQFIIATHHPLFLTMRGTNTIVFGDNPKYGAMVLRMLRKRLA